MLHHLSGGCDGVAFGYRQRKVACSAKVDQVGLIGCFTNKAGTILLDLVGLFLRMDDIGFGIE